VLRKKQNEKTNPQTQDCTDYLQTFSEFRHVVVRWFAQMDEEVREIATDSDGKDKCGTNPKRTLKGNKQLQEQLLCPLV